MAKSVFNKKLPRSCGYCAHSVFLEFTKEVICKKHGATNLRDYCRNYKYDPLKRTPKRLDIDNNYSPDDFEI